MPMVHSIRTAIDLHLCHCKYPMIQAQTIFQLPFEAMQPPDRFHCQAGTLLEIKLSLEELNFAPYGRMHFICFVPQFPFGKFPGQRRTAGIKARGGCMFLWASRTSWTSRTSLIPDIPWIIILWLILAYGSLEASACNHLFGFEACVLAVAACLFAHCGRLSTKKQRCSWLSSNEVIWALWLPPQWRGAWCIYASLICAGSIKNNYIDNI